MKKRVEKRFQILPDSNKGLSAIVATLLIILLVIVAAGIVWVVVRNVINQGAGEIELGQFTFDLSIKSAYIDGANVNVVIRRSPGGGNLTGVRFIFFDGTNSVSVDRKIPLAELQERLFDFNSEEVGGIDNVQTVSVAPIYKLASGSEKTGDITDTATISSSSSGNGDGGIPECDDETDNDGDGSIDLNDAGCDNALDEDETNCGDGVCEGGENIGSCPSDCSESPDSCDGSWSPPEDPGVECDGGTNCNPDCTCSVGFTADGAGGCNLNPPINSGEIYSVWPDGAVKYIDSENLPIDVSEYTSYYVNFTSVNENGCFRITWAEYLETNGRSYIRT
ncbi:MAG TPA: hypothetical protein VMV95_01115, partial [Bacillota bacterium]|nr:hypothetical protein [Bacillota bacterium]